MHSRRESPRGSRHERGTNLQRLLLLHRLLVRPQIPLARWSQASVGLLDAAEVIHLEHRSNKELETNRATHRGHTQTSS